MNNTTSVKSLLIKKMSKKQIIIILSFIIILSLITYSYLTYKNYQLKKDLQRISLLQFPERIKTPTPNISSSPLQELPSPSPTLTYLPTNTKKLTYNLPSGWQTIEDSEKKFQIGFNPRDFTALSYPKRIDLIYKQCCFRFSIRIEPYDGGSKHNFLKQFFEGYMVTPNTLEKNYLVNGKVGLVLYNIEYSSTIIIGMLNIDGENAFLFSSTGGNQKEIEQILSTIKLL